MGLRHLLLILCTQDLHVCVEDFDKVNPEVNTTSSSSKDRETSASAAYGNSVGMFSVMWALIQGSVTNWDL